MGLHIFVEKLDFAHFLLEHLKYDKHGLLKKNNGGGSTLGKPVISFNIDVFGFCNLEKL